MLWIRYRHVTKIAKATEAEINPSKNIKYGEFLDIKISRRTNKRLLSYAKTAFHEFLHAIFIILDRYFDYEVTAQSEHEFIDAMEDGLVACWYLLKERKRSHEKNQ